MPEKKKQHYVPQFYLRYFSSPCKKNISIFNTCSDKYIRCGPIKSQAYDDYLYGKDGLMENSLGYIEENFIEVIESIVFHNGRVFFYEVLYRNVLLYMVVQLNRTLMVKEIYEKHFSEMMRISIDIHPDLKIKRTKDPKFGFGEVLQNCIIESVKMVPCLFDLEYKVLINNSEDEFITSDNPVVKYNMFMEAFKLPPGGTGLVSRGLQIFYPITKKYMLYFYDRKVYRTGLFFRKFIYISDKGTVKKLNALQYLNCRENVFFSDKVTEYYIRRLLRRYKKYRINDFNPVEVFVRKDKPNAPERLVHFRERILRIDLKLDFVNIRLNTYFKKYGKSFAIPRSRKLRKYVDELEQKMNNKNPIITSTE